MTFTPRIASMLVNQVHAITPEAAAAVLAVLEGRLNVSANFVGEPAFEDRTGRPKGFRITNSGVAILPIVGELVARGGWIGAQSGVTSYEGLRQVIKAAAGDQTVKAVVLDIDSPGGMVTGMFETAAHMKVLAALKPVYAVANPLIASAAYGLASQATAIIATPDSAVGSIGVLYVHVDRSVELTLKGQRVTIIKAGARKVDGNSLEPLAAHYRAEVEARVGSVYERFIALVADGRGKRLPAEAARATEAKVMVPEEAKSAGLVDWIATFDVAVAAAERQGGSTAARAKTGSLSSTAIAASSTEHGRSGLARAVAELVARRP